MRVAPNLGWVSAKSYFIFWMICILAVPAFAVTVLNGTLTDPQGQVVPDATIRLFRRANSDRRETRADAQGRFSFGGLDGGENRLTASRRSHELSTCWKRASRHKTFSFPDSRLDQNRSM